MSGIRQLLRRVLALAILAAIPLAIWLGFIDPSWQRWTDRADTRARSMQLLEAFQQTAALQPSLDARLKALQMRERTAPGFVSAASSTLAGAALQAEVKRIIESRGGQVRSIQALTPTQEQGFEKIAVRFDLVASLDALPNIIYEIEAHVPYLFIDHLYIHAPEDGRSEIYAADRPVLAIRWDVSGYRSPGAT